MATVYIRNVSPYTIKMLDEQASKLGISRNEYCNKIFDSFVIKEELNQSEEKYNSLVKTVANVVSENTKSLNDLKEMILDLELEKRGAFND